MKKILNTILDIILILGLIVLLGGIFINNPAVFTIGALSVLFSGISAIYINS